MINEDEKLLLKSLKSFQSLKLIDPDFSKIHYHIAMCYSNLDQISYENKYFTNTINEFEKAILQDPEDDLTYLEWGLFLISSNDTESSSKNDLYSKAQEKISKSGELGNLHAYYYLACLYSLQNHLEASMYLLKKSNEFSILPDIEDLIEDIWLENVRLTSEFNSFIYSIKK